MLRFARFDLDEQTGELFEAGRPVKLKPQAARVLALLARRHGTVVTREEIRRELWGDDTFVDFDLGINSCIRQVRRALNDDSEAPRFVQTLPNRGYRFVIEPQIEASMGQPTGTPAGAREVVLAELDDERSVDAVPTSPAARGFRRSTRAAAAVLAGAATVSLAAYLAFRSDRGPPTRPFTTTYLQMEIPEGRLWGGNPDEARIGGYRPSRASFAIAPDGSAVVYAAIDDEEAEPVASLWLRRLDEPVAVEMPGTEGASNPFFSPDGAWIGFTTDDYETLKVVSARGGPARIIGTGGRHLTLSWSENDDILFMRDWEIYRTTPSGASPERLTERRRENGEHAHIFPRWLPDRRTLLFTIAKGREYLEESTVVARREGSVPVILLENAMDARYLPTGHLVFARQGTLMAVRFDPYELELTGEPVRVLDDIMQSLGSGNSGLITGNGHFAVSDSGTLVYASGGLIEPHTMPLVWVDPGGEPEPLPIPVSHHLYPRLSPDGRKLAVSMGLLERELVVIDVETGAMARPGVDRVVGLAWSPDGERLAVSKAEDGTYLIDADDSTGAHAPERLALDRSRVHDWSVTGVLLMNKDTDIWTLDVENEKDPQLFVGGPSREVLAAFSPDGRWLAYVSDESGREEVYVRPYPGPDPFTPVTRDGGSRPVWSRDGRRLFYRSGTDNRSKMMAVEVSITGDTFRPGPVHELFERRYLGSAPLRSYDVAPDGRFLMAEDLGPRPQPVTRLHVVLNWFQELERLVP